MTKNAATSHVAFITADISPSPSDRPAWDVTSVVVHGDARGRTMGFPTANMHLEEGHPLRFGIYAVRVGILAGQEVISRHDGVANFGIRPMYRISRPLLEVHLFDFDGDLYGKTLGVRFASFLRPEAAFAGLDALIAQIGEDARQAKAFLTGQDDNYAMMSLRGET